MARRSLIDALLAPRIAALLEALPAALAGHTAGVHRARVGSRRLREVLPSMRLLLSAHDVERARLEVRRVTRTLGPVRELDVALALFDELSARHGLAAAARAAVRRVLAADRGAAAQRMRAAWPPRRRARLERALAALASEATASEPFMAAVDTRVERRGQRLRDALEHAGTLYVPERLHRVRIAVKQLRYALEVAGEARRARVSARVAQLRRIQDLLGRAHDLHVLSERVRAVQSGLVRTSRRTASELDRLALALDAECRVIHAAFMSRRRGLLTLCAALEGPGTAAGRSVA